MNQWDGIRFFRPDDKFDNWGDPSKIKRKLLVKLDKLRAAIGQPIFVTSGYRKSTTSQHGKGIAVDIVCPSMGLFDFYLAAEKQGFNGIGVYPHWKYKKTRTGGLHVDVRAIPGRWIGYLPDGEKKQRYTALNSFNLEKHGIV